MNRYIEALRHRARLLKAETYALYLAYGDPRTPWYARGLAMLVLAYAFSPLDLIPDFIPVLGYLDDLVLVPAGIALVLRMIPSEVLVDARAQAKMAMQQGQSKNWTAGLIVIVTWLLAVVCMVATVMHAVR